MSITHWNLCAMKILWMSTKKCYCASLNTLQICAISNDPIQHTRNSTTVPGLKNSP